MKLFGAFVLCFSIVLVGIYAQTSEDGVRVEFHVRRINNDKGFTQKNRKCDIGSPCDSRLTADVDISSPKRGWPGTKRLESWTRMFDVTDENSPAVNKYASEDLCTGSYKQDSGILRMHLVDVDTGSNDFIDDFECPCTGVRVATNEHKATWSDDKVCSGIYNPSNAKVTYRCRAYHIPTTSCGKPSSRP